MSMSISDVTSDAPSFVQPSASLYEEAIRKIEVANKKALDKAQELTGEARTILESRIKALAQDLKDSLDQFGYSGISDNEQMCRNVDHFAKRLTELSESSVTNI